MRKFVVAATFSNARCRHNNMAASF